MPPVAQAGEKERQVGKVGVCGWEKPSKLWFVFGALTFLPLITIYQFAKMSSTLAESKKN